MKTEKVLCRGGKTFKIKKILDGKNYWYCSAGGIKQFLPENMAFGKGCKDRRVRLHTEVRTRLNPNNCETCDYKEQDTLIDGSFCYMFETAPTDICFKHSQKVRKQCARELNDLMIFYSRGY